jgi:anthranilate synthase/aminodeoxychorismate synthase-like glutamine amidotransferase
MIDNYDSFTFNLVQLLAAYGAEVEVVRNDGVSAGALADGSWSGLVISPGPGRPDQAGITLDAVRAFAARGAPVLGVCLGHQALAVAFGGRVGPAPSLRHGKAVPIRHGGDGLLEGIPSPFPATVYHSLVVEEATLPRGLEITARGPDGEIMALCHRRLPLEGVQFHPESILTRHGPALIEGFVARCRREARA